MSGKVILNDGSEHTIEAPHVIKIEGDDLYVDGEVISLPQHKRIVIVVGDIEIVSSSKIDIAMFFGNVGKVLLTTGSVTVNGSVNEPIRDSCGPVIVNGVEMNKK